MAIAPALSTLDADLRRIFGDRLQALIAYAPHAARAHALAVVDRLGADDLRDCAANATRWHAAGLAVPLLLEAEEFARSLDAFPLEFGAILADYQVVSGRDVLAELRVDPDDVRRACEVQCRSHLLHLREGYLEGAGHDRATAQLIVASAPALATLLTALRHLPNAPAIDATLARVEALAPRAGREAGTLSADEGRTLFPAYLDAMDRLVSAVDAWSGR